METVTVVEAGDVAWAVKALIVGFETSRSTATLTGAEMFPALSLAQAYRVLGPVVAVVGKVNAAGGVVFQVAADFEGVVALSFTM
jgi:hypothetical protein